MPRHTRQKIPQRSHLIFGGGGFKDIRSRGAGGIYPICEEAYKDWKEAANGNSGRTPFPFACTG
jgi:hypothetical protein